MSLIEKIDAEIAVYKDIQKRLDVEGSVAFQNIINGMNVVREIILSEQKEPCYSQDDCEMKQDGKCFLDGPCPRLVKPLTIGDKIRESNESLAEFIKWQWADERVIIHGKEFDIDDYLNQPYTDS